jgi:hypothetical protein
MVRKLKTEYSEKITCLSIFVGIFVFTGTVLWFAYLSSTEHNNATETTCTIIGDKVVKRECKIHTGSYTSYYVCYDIDVWLTYTDGETYRGWARLATGVRERPQHIVNGTKVLCWYKPRDATWITLEMKSPGVYYGFSITAFVMAGLTLLICMINVSSPEFDQVVVEDVTLQSVGVHVTIYT